VRWSAGLLLALGLGACRPEPPPEGMVRIPAGAFIMGSNRTDDEGLGPQMGLVRPLYQDEHPERRVTLPDYFIDRFETTNREYLEFLRATRWPAPPQWQGDRFPEGKADHPVAHVTWFDADAYCSWRGKRLPTEAEWEKAARASDGRDYPWGNAFDAARANTGESEFDDTVPVGRYEAGKSPYGLYDMAGNVTEWTQDWFQPYPGSPHPPGPLHGERFKVLRGGSWGGGGGHYAMGIFYRSAHRLFGEPAGRYPDTGFRCARSAR
jgi:formylglycine-generating enzyme required for sulfatase activity